MPRSTDAMMKMYQEDTSLYDLEEIDGFVYCLFTYKDSVFCDQLILLAYEGDTVIADLSGVHNTMDQIMKNKAVYDDLSEESDWMYLAHYTLCNLVYPDFPYPFCDEQDDEIAFPGEVLLYRNAYVTRSYRKQGIFTSMLDLCKEWIFQNLSGEITYYTCISMDLDIACYGPDTTNEPYIYNFEVDEPIRMENKQILETLGYSCVRLEEDEPGDGSKCWFAIKKENDFIVETTLS